MGHLPVVLLLNAVTVSLVAFGVLALAAALLLVVGAARRRSRSHTVDPTRPPTAAPRTHEEPPTMADDPQNGAPGVLAETSDRTNGTESTDSPAAATSAARARSNGRSRRRATAPTTTPAPPAATPDEPAVAAEPAAEPAAAPAAEPVATPAEPVVGPAEPAEATASVPGGTRVRPEPAPDPAPEPVPDPAGEATSEAAPARKGRGTRAAKTGMKAATPGEAASPATRSSRSRARTTAPEAPVPVAVPTPPMPAGPAGGRFLAPRRGRVKALLDVLDVPGAVVRPRDDVAAVLTRFYADAVRAHDAVHIVQLTDAARADVGVELHAAGHIVGDARPYRDLTTDATPEAASPGWGLHGLRRPRVDGVAVKALRGASSAVLVVDSRRSRPAAVADAAAMLDGLGVTVRGVVVWKGRIPRA